MSIDEEIHQFISDKAIGYPKINFDVNVLVLDSPMFNVSILADLSFAILGAYAISLVDLPIEIVGAIFIIASMLIFAWMDFDEINKVSISLRLKEIILESKNPFKKIFGNKKWNFNEIQKFETKQRKTTKFVFDRYYVIMVLKNGQSLKITGSGNMDDVTKLSHLLNRLL